MILLGVRVTLIEGKRPRSKRVKFPLIRQMAKVDLTTNNLDTLNFLDAMFGWHWFGPTYHSEGRGSGLRSSQKKSLFCRFTQFDSTSPPHINSCDGKRREKNARGLGTMKGLRRRTGSLPFRT